MANDKQTAGSTIKSISPFLSAIPYVGSILSGVGGAVGGMLETQGAEEQAKQKNVPCFLDTSPAGVR